uniref:Tyrosine-protein phosphatase domain-containing protein n=1 Tax=Rhabditophanes sp. KR3021 TaxID=114890 RepID=A0AC35TLC6_9BILA
MASSQQYLGLTNGYGQPNSMDPRDPNDIASFWVLCTTGDCARVTLLLTSIEAAPLANYYGNGYGPDIGTGNEIASFWFLCTERNCGREANKFLIPKNASLQSLERILEIDFPKMYTQLTNSTNGRYKDENIYDEFEYVTNNFTKERLINMMVEYEMPDFLLNVPDYKEVSKGRLGL